MSRHTWRHLTLLALLALLPTIAQMAIQFHRDAPQLGWFEALYAGTLMGLTFPQIGVYLAVAAGIAVGVGAVGRGGLRTAVSVAIVTTLAIIVLDAVVGPSATRVVKAAAKHAARSAETSWPRFFSDTTISSRADTLGQLRTGLQLLRDKPAELSATLGRSWSSDHPRALATSASIFAPTLLLPFIAVGIVLGAVTWLRQRATFRAPSDETVARWVMSWILAALVCGFLSRWSQGMNWRTLHENTYWLPMEPYWIFLGLAALGWRAAIRDRSTPA
jgi:hypothetical protein